MTRYYVIACEETSEGYNYEWWEFNRKQEALEWFDDRQSDYVSMEIIEGIMIKTN